MSLLKFNKVFTILIALVLFTSCNILEPIDADGSIKRSFTTPPGTIKVKNNLYIDKVPVTNAMYNEFLEQVQNTWSLNRSVELQELPSYGISRYDVFKMFNGDYSLYEQVDYKDRGQMVTTKLDLKNYIGLPYYESHPAINMDKVKAETFCKWRTDIANAVYALNSDTRRQRARYPARVEYRLPTYKEIEDIQYQMQVNRKLEFYEDLIYAFEGDIDLFKNMQDREKMTILELYEVGADSTYLGTLDRNLSYYDLDEVKTGFRCVCEVTR